MGTVPREFPEGRWGMALQTTKGCDPFPLDRTEIFLKRRALSCSDSYSHILLDEPPDELDVKVPVRKPRRGGKTISFKRVDALPCPHRGADFLHLAAWHQVASNPSEREISSDCRSTKTGTVAWITGRISRGLSAGEITKGGQSADASLALKNGQQPTLNLRQ